MDKKTAGKAFKTVIQVYEDLSIIKKSKFYTYLFPCDSVEAFEEELENMKRKHNGANHACYAYRIMEEVLVERYQDDKEPSGTAGIPILDVMKGHDLIQCGILVFRFFGGTKLGTGGLSRAYSGGAIHVVEMAEIVSKESAAIIGLVVDYGMTGKLEHYFTTHKLALLDTRYESRVTYEVAVRSNEESDFHHAVMEMTNGQCDYEEVKTVMGYFSEGGFAQG